MIPKEKYMEWLQSPIIGEQQKKEMKAMSEEEIEGAFLGDLTFGTAGLRGLMGLGTNRMNIYTVKKAAIAIGQWILEKYPNNTSIVIGYDMRHHSKEFAEESARTLSNLGVRVFLFDTIVATPELSYAIRYLKTSAGIMVTASHNPRDYNGYKVYAEKGSQILYDDADRIQQWMSKVPHEALKTTEGVAWQTVPKDLLQEYENEVMALQTFEISTPKVPFVYSPYNGCAKRAMESIFTKAGFDFIMPEEQIYPDPDFSTIPYPNPEMEETFAIAKKLAIKTNRNLILANDPDGDRLSAMVWKGDAFHHLTGNQLGALFTAYLCQQRKDKTKHGVLVKTIVTDDFGATIAKDYGHRVVETLTGFKNIAEIAHRLDGSEEDFVLGYEESIGYELTDFVRDKDGISAAFLLAEMAEYYAVKEKTLWDILQDLYRRYGFHAENNFSVYFEGLDGKKRMDQLMETFRNKDIDTLADRKVLNRVDYSLEKDPFMRTNALVYTLEGGVRLAIRPSGTEPKLKFYIYAVDLNHRKAEEEVHSLGEEMKRRAK
ncbi:MAG: phospho-sugar mutase [Tissierellia bacterium]|nr:phospho-sugar mutase [Tissierellia bacterium]